MTEFQKSVEIWIGLISKFGLFAVTEAFGLLFLMRALANFDLRVALTGIGLIVIGGIFETGVWLYSSQMWREQWRVNQAQQEKLDLSKPAAPGSPRAIS